MVIFKWLSIPHGKDSYYLCNIITNNVCVPIYGCFHKLCTFNNMCSHNSGCIWPKLCILNFQVTLHSNLHKPHFKTHLILTCEAFCLSSEFSYAISSKLLHGTHHVTWRKRKKCDPSFYYVYLTNPSSQGEEWRRCMRWIMSHSRATQK